MQLIGAGRGQMQRASSLGVLVVATSLRLGPCVNGGRLRPPPPLPTPAGSRRRTTAVLDRPPSTAPPPTTYAHTLHCARASINFSSLYIIWLCSAVFYHLPSLERMGVDVKADVSMLIVSFLASLLVSGGGSKAPWPWASGA